MAIPLQMTGGVNSTLHTLAHAQFYLVRVWLKWRVTYHRTVLLVCHLCCLEKKIHSSRMSTFRTNGGITIWPLYMSPTTSFSLLLLHIFAGREHHSATVAVHCDNIRSFHSCAIPVKPMLFPHFLPNRVLVRDVPLAGVVRSLFYCPQSSGSAILGCWTLAVLCISTNCQYNFFMYKQFSVIQSQIQVHLTDRR